MRILSFHEDYAEDIISGKKVATVRLKPHRDDYYQVWAPGPRSGRGVFRGGIAIEDVRECAGQDLTDDDARRDGFDTLDEMLQALAKHNRMSVEEVLETTWYIHKFRFLPQVKTAKIVGIYP